MVALSRSSRSMSAAATVRPLGRASCLAALVERAEHLGGQPQGRYVGAAPPRSPCRGWPPAVPRAPWGDRSAAAVGVTARLAAGAR